MFRLTLTEKAVQDKINNVLIKIALDKRRKEKKLLSFIGARGMNGGFRTMKQGFDHKLYIQKQSEKILETAQRFNNKLYLEFGGKLFDDLHASRVLPGFYPDAKIKLLEEMKDQLEVIICINAADIEKNKIRADYGITYDMEVLRMMDNLRARGLSINSVVITLFENQPAAKLFANQLKRKKQQVYFHTKTKGYPTDVDTVVSEEGFGANDYIPTTKPLVVVTAPGPCSGKLGTCLSQMYHEHRRGIESGYAKFETFPVWNLPLKHLVNVAYEASTADLRDSNMIDPYHLQAYGTIAVNYNRDIEVFPILREILLKITGKSIYQSPTDMGVNMIGYAITDEESVRTACRLEIIRRYYKELVIYKKGYGTYDAAERIKLLMNENKIDIGERKCITAANRRIAETNSHCISVEMQDGTIITGRTKGILTASGAVILNAVKHLAKMADKVKLISPEVLEPLLAFKRDIMGFHEDAVLNLKDVLLVLAIGANDDKLIRKAYDQLPLLRGLEAHSTNILNRSDEETFRRLGIQLTSEPVFRSNNLYDQ